MFIRRRKSWEIRESQATAEGVLLSRRAVVAGAGAAAGAVAIGFGLARPDEVAADTPDPTASLYPAKRNEAFKLDRDITPEKANLNWNNFYEYGETKTVASAAQSLKVRPWTVKIDGMVEKEREVGIDDLIKAMPVEERLYRHRCVEAWGMAIPWTGFPFKAFLDFAKPLSSAKYVQMETFNNPRMAPGQRLPYYPWPYVEGLTMEEAANELAFLVTGAYGKPLAKQFGAPLRLAVPWKYGFKSIKSIVRVSFTDKRPVGMWEKIQASEYGFWANVNPEVPHPRWSQAMEDVLGTYDRRPTLLFNGYGESVAGLYKDLQSERLYA
ncbi:MAG: protein-methionine-sulfoxide reductase catalytic subunit MsrP [Methylobacteriaceae bacterium]|nr:protein-methionine-sulfoxide reductase catalytic subunit MsrP [Methylobacteriaceae bacterium]